MKSFVDSNVLVYLFDQDSPDKKAAAQRIIQTEGVLSVAFSPDATHLLSSNWDKTVKLWKASTGELLRTFEGHSD